MANYKSGMKMQMGSKQKNTPSNFKEKDAMLMNHVDPSASGQYDMYGDYYKDAMNSLGQDQMENMSENFGKAMSGYEPPIQLVSKNTGGGDHEAYASLGKGLRKLITPKKGTEGYARQQERKANRLVERYKRSDVDPSDSGYKAAEENLNKLKNKKGTQTKVGEKLRDIKKKIFK